MPGERSLFERLRMPAGARRLRPDTEALQESVLANLRRIFNTHQVQVATLDDYGMPDLTNVAHSFPDSIDTVRRAIHESIVRYEPRLQGVRVRHIADDVDPQLLRFEIVGRVAAGSERHAVRYESIVNPAGRVRVRG
jgi:type VI secretion system protein